MQYPCLFIPPLHDMTLSVIRKWEMSSVAVPLWTAYASEKLTRGRMSSAPRPSPCALLQHSVMPSHREVSASSFSDGMQEEKS